LGDRVQLQQVLLNLIMNAVESISAVTDRPKMLAISSEPVEPDGLQVAVEDTGTGLDPAIADWVFDSFVTTKPERMGMGLSICRSIIAAHAGASRHRRVYRTAPSSDSLCREYRRLQLDRLPSSVEAYFGSSHRYRLSHRVQSVIL
jgi:signal transduction histidine kinase